MEIVINYKAIRNGYVRIGAQGELVLSIPRRMKNDEAFKNLLIERGQVLLQKHEKRTKIQTTNDGMVMLFGEQITLKDFYASQGIKEIPSSKIQNLKSKILKESLYEYSKPILDTYSQKLGIPYAKLSIRKTTSKRGSCTHDQAISLNLSLVHLPTKYIRYVIIHEACHLKIKNHSPKFRSLVEIHCPDYKIIRKELRNFVLT